MAYIVIYLVEYKIFYEHVIGITSFIPCMIVGFFMGKTDLFNKTYYVIKKNTKFDVIIGVVFVVASFSLRLFKPFALTFDTGCFSVPVLILGLLLSGILDNRVVGSILKYLGRLSFSIWLFHCIYFSENSNIQMQRYIYVCGSPLVNFIILLLECMLLCSLIEKIIFIFRSKINMWLKISSHC